MINNLQESENCMLCKKARCQKNCPINTPIPQVIQLYKNGEIEKAGEILFNNNPLSVICAIVCPHEKQCRGNCIRGIKKEPVHFHSIEQEISTEYLKNTKFIKPESNGIKVAVIGSGPAGLTVAFELAKKGYDVTIFEKNEKIGGVLTYGIPDFRLSRELIDLLVSRLLDLGVKIKINSIVGPVITLNKLFKDGYKSIFIGTGVWNPKRLDIKGETFGHSHYAIDYLKSPKYYSLGKKVVVIGAGNVAMDAARTAIRLGADVTVLYRKTQEEMPAIKSEYEEALKEGVKFEWKTTVEAFLKGKNGRLGSCVLNTPEGERVEKFDRIYLAIGSRPANRIVSTTEGIEVDEKGYVKVVERPFGMTTRRGVFAGGDVVHRPQTVVLAMKAAKEVAQGIAQYVDAIKLLEEAKRIEKQGIAE